MIKTFTEYLNEGIGRFDWLIDKDYKTPYKCELANQDEARYSHMVPFTFKESKYVFLYTSDYKYHPSKKIMLFFDFEKYGIDFQVQKRQKVGSDETFFIILVNAIFGKDSVNVDQDKIFKCNSLVSCFKKMDEILKEAKSKRSAFQNIKDFVM